MCGYQILATKLDPQPQLLSATGLLATTKEDRMRSSSKSMVEPRRSSSDTGSMRTRVPLSSTRTSSSFFLKELKEKKRSPAMRCSCRTVVNRQHPSKCLFIGERKQILTYGRYRRRIGNRYNHRLRRRHGCRWGHQVFAGRGQARGGGGGEKTGP